MTAHILKLDCWLSGNYYYVGDINAIGKQGNQWYVPAHLLGLEPIEFIALLISCFNATILDWNGSLLQYGFKNKKDADEFCKYINNKSKLVSFYV